MYSIVSAIGSYFPWQWSILALYEGATLCILVLFLFILVVNLLTFQRLRSVQQVLAHPLEDETRPLLSILVPARNEERCIERCVRSLLAQSYERLEVVVLDDESSDATASIVRGLIAELPEERSRRLRLLSGAALPAGWVGKNFACYQLAQQARGDYLLFTDADTVHATGTAQAVLDCMRQTGAKLLTAQPAFELGSLGERLVVPLLNFTILTLLPVALIPRRPEPSLATGNGQLLCFHRPAYERIGGHAAVKDRILEDVLLARAIKRAGYRMIFVDAFELVGCRMYHSFGDVWRGFSKNLFAFYNYSLPFALVALLLNLALFVVPPLVLVADAINRLLANITNYIPRFPVGLITSMAVAYLLVVVMRVLLALRFTRERLGLMLLLCLVHPASILLECLILLNSLYWHYSKRGTVWKGRRYTKSMSL